MTTERPERDVRRLSTPRAAGLAGVLFAVLFGVAIALIHTALPEGAQPGAQVGIGDRPANGPRQRRRPERRGLLTHPLQLVLGHRAQHGGGAVVDGQDDDQVAQPLEHGDDRVLVRALDRAATGGRGGSGVGHQSRPTMTSLALMTA